MAAATRDNIRRSYRGAGAHFTSQWGGFLPATGNSVAQYLTAYAGHLAHNTLKQRLAALGQRHLDQGFPDPTKAPIVKKVLRGIKELHPEQEKRAKPLQLEDPEKVSTWLNKERENARLAGRHADLLHHTRDLALVLIGF